MLGSAIAAAQLSVAKDLLEKEDEEGIRRKRTSPAENFKGDV